VASALGHDELVDRFRAAMIEEEQHLVRVRRWVRAAVTGEAGAAT
jgi:hypothetical protein